MLLGERDLRWGRMPLAVTVEGWSNGGASSASCLGASGRDDLARALVVHAHGRAVVAAVFLVVVALGLIWGGCQP